MVIHVVLQMKKCIFFKVIDENTFSIVYFRIVNYFFKKTCGRKIWKKNMFNHAKPEEFFSMESITFLQQEIRYNNGNEVFFVGQREKEDRITKAKVVARGNEVSVPIIFREAYKGDYIIHNHPSGDLTPSANDLEIAGYFGNQGIGFIIVDNDLSGINVVIVAPEIHQSQKLEVSSIANILKPDGKIAKSLKTYEYRKAQEDMLVEILTSFNESYISIIEAGTGTGKSLAYLVPAIFWSINNKEKVIISTNTINLQEQICKKDIPFLKKALDINFSDVLVKGRGNYLCLKKLYRLSTEGSDELFDEDEANVIQSIKQSVPSLKEGTRDELSFIPDRNVWDKISSDSDTCARQKCPHLGTCFFTKARSDINKANILIVNHHILCSDIAIKREKASFDTHAILPAYERIVVDEAHNLENVATNYFGKSVSYIAMIRSLNSLFSVQKGKPKGILAYLYRQLKKAEVKYHDLSALSEQLREEIQQNFIEMRSHIEDFYMNFFNFILKKLSETENKLRFTDKILDKDFYNTLRPMGKALCERIISAVQQLFTLLEKIEKVIKEEEDLKLTLMEASSYGNRFIYLANNLETFLYFKNDDSVYWVEIRNRDRYYLTRLNVSPLDISELMKDFFFQLTESAILTSATLASDRDFSYFKERTGLDKLETKTLKELILPSPFDYSKQSSICVPKDISEPQDASYNDEINKYIHDIVSISNGSTFLLFTSFYSLNQCYKYLSQTLGTRYLLLKQGMMDRHTLISKFKSTKYSILLGTDSFWEGVDVEGDALRCLVISKLPFRVPSEPIIQARVEKLNNEGKNAFMEYYLPQTIIKFKQGFGRLIRTKKDHGVFISLDKRLITRSYGKKFLSSLPPCKRLIGTRPEILREIESHFVDK